MNICIIVPGMPSSEKEWFLPYLTEYLRRLSLEADIHVYALTYPGKESKYDLFGIPVTSFEGGWLRLQRRVMNEVLSDHKKKPFTHVHAIWANSAGFFGAMAARNLNLPFVVTIGGEELVRMPEIKYGALLKKRTRPILRYVFQIASVIVAASSNTKNKLFHQWNVKEEQIRQVHFGVDTARFKLSENKKQGFHVVAVGGLIPVKRHSLLLKAFAQLNDANPDAHLTIAGEGELRKKYETLCSKLGITEKISLPGWIHHNNMPELYQKADAFALTSYSEEIPVALLEALACGLPVVSVNVGIAYDLSETKQYPIHIAEPTPEGIAESLEMVYKERDAHKRQALTNDVLATLSVDRTVEKMFQVFFKLSSKHSST